MYFHGASSLFKKNEYKRKVLNNLELLKENLERAVFWDKRFKDECNRFVLDESKKDDYDKDLVELQRIINKILGGENNEN